MPLIDTFPPVSKSFQEAESRLGDDRGRGHGPYTLFPGVPDLSGVICGFPRRANTWQTPFTWALSALFLSHASFAELCSSAAFYLVVHRASSQHSTVGPGKGSQSLSSAYGIVCCVLCVFCVLCFEGSGSLCNVARSVG